MAETGLNPNAMAVPNVARLLTRTFGTPVSEEMIRADIDAGAPTNADGTINLVNYAAWLVQQEARCGD